jgi:hypothetical protein
MMHA